LGEGEAFFPKKSPELERAQPSRTYPLPQLFGELFAAEDVEVDMFYALAAVIADVGDDPVAGLVDADDAGDLLTGEQKTAQKLLIAVFCCVEGSDVLFGDDDDVFLGLGGDIAESENLFVLIYLGGGDIPGNYFAEQAIHF